MKRFLRVRKVPNGNSVSRPKFIQNINSSDWKKLSQRYRLGVKDCSAFFHYTRHALYCCCSAPVIEVDGAKLTAKVMCLLCPGGFEMHPKNIISHFDLKHNNTIPQELPWRKVVRGLRFAKDCAELWRAPTVTVNQRRMAMELMQPQQWAKFESLPKMNPMQLYHEVEEYAKKLEKTDRGVRGFSVCRPEEELDTEEEGEEEKVDTKEENEENTDASGEED